MPRKLATVERIKQIIPIPDADFIEAAVVRGWSVVVVKGTFKAGDRVIYCEIDSLLPIKEEFEFLRKSSYISEPEGFRLRTVKLRGQISQGLILPLSVLPPVCLPVIFDGMDVTDILGIQLYEPPQVARLSGDIAGMFPWFIPQTDLERVQNLDLADFKDKLFTVTEKLDGTSFTCYKHEGHFGVCSRNWELTEGDNTYWNIAKKYELDKRLPEGFAIQGEIIGNGIQGNPYKLKDHQLFVYNVLTISDRRYLTYKEQQEIIRLTLRIDSLKQVPWFSFIDINSFDKGQLKFLLKLSNRPSILNPNQKAEGLVFSCVEDGKKTAFKVISNNYLLETKS